MTITRKTVGKLVVGDRLVDCNGMELRVTALVPFGAKRVSVTVEYVYAGTMIVRPEPTTLRLRTIATVEAIG